MSESGAGRTAGLFRSIGSAVGFVRRLVPGSAAKIAKVARMPGRPPKPAPMTPARKPAVRPMREGGEPSLSDSDRKREALQKQVARLESELEGVYAAIAACTVGQSLDPRTSTAALNEHIARQRALKDELFAARVELSRVERFLARERRLQQLPETEDAGAPPARPAAAKRKRAGKTVDLGAIVAAAHKTLKGAGADPDLDRLAEALRHDNPDVRRDAVARLGEIGGKNAFALLMVAIEDRVERVRVSALHALARSGQPAAADVFRSLAHDPSPQIRLAALRGLATTDPEGRHQELLAALDDDDPDVRKAVASMLGWHHVPEAVRPLCFILRDRDDDVRVAAAQALADLRDDAAVLSLLRALDDARPRVAEAIVAAVVAIAGDEVRELIGPDPTRADVPNLVEWWKQARVSKRIERLGLTDLPVEAVAPARVVERARQAALVPPPLKPAPAAKPAAPALPAQPAPAAAKARPEPAKPAPGTTAFESLLGEEVEAFSPTGEQSTEGEAGAFESLLGGEEEQDGLDSTPEGVFESLVPDEASDESAKEPEPKKRPPGT